MDWLQTLLSWFASFANLMAQWAATSEGWIWPLNALAPLMRGLSGVADGLFSGFFDFVQWAARVERDIQEFVTQSWVWDVVSGIVDSVQGVIAWFSNWWGNVASVISSWWSGMQATVLGWIEAARSWAADLIETVRDGLNEVTAAWDRFVNDILPGLASRLDVSDFVLAALAPWRALFNFWGEFGGNVVEFFSDPIEFIWNRFTDWFFGG